MKGIFSKTSVIVTCVLLTAMAVVCQAAVYYVSPTGDDLNSGTSPGTAWATVNHGDAANILNPGDTVVVLEGTYAVNNTYIQNRSGTAGNPVTYIAQGDVVLQAPSGSGGLYVQASHVVIDGFRFQGGTVSSILISNAENVVVRNNWLTAPNDPGFWYGAINLGNNVKDASIHHNVIAPNAGIISTGILMQGTSLGGNKIYNNTLVDVGPYYWSLQVDNSAAGDEFFNNIMAYNAAGINLVEPVAQLTHSNNLFYLLYGGAYTYGGSATQGPGELLDTDPLFVDYANRDFRLSPGSPAIDAGKKFAGLDYNGLAPDIGAFEYVPEPGSICALAFGLSGFGLAAIRRRRS